MKAPPPLLLRSPPFPHVSPEAAAVSVRVEGETVSAPSPDQLDHAERLAIRMAEARVGGEFWNRGDALSMEGTDTAERRTIGRLRALADTTIGESDRHELRLLAFEQLLNGIRYRNPFTGEDASPETAIQLLEFWRKTMERLPGFGAGKTIAVGIARWKRREVERLLWAGPATSVTFANRETAALAGARAANAPIVGWPSRVSPALAGRAAEAGRPYYHVEDGFIRSIGLGAGCHPPFSIVVDGRGIHYDPAVASDLEILLQTAAFEPELLDRAQALIDRIVEARVGKYGAGEAQALPPRTRRRVLVAGQVEDDLSVLKGGGAITSNMDLLVRAREQEPDAELWFKPHPDVDAGHRRGHIPDQEALAYADRVVRDLSMASLFEGIDAIHVLTSLAGFEALLRGLDVVVHGAPFYAGWGLTRDLGEVPERRTRRLTLRHLTAGVLLLYPFHLDPVTNLPCPPEILIRRLSERRTPQGTWLTRFRHLQGRVRRMASEFGIK